MEIFIIFYDGGGSRFIEIGEAALHRKLLKRGNLASSPWFLHVKASLCWKARSIRIGNGFCFEVHIGEEKKDHRFAADKWRHPPRDGITGTMLIQFQIDCLLCLVIPPELAYLMDLERGVVDENMFRKTLQV